jgi:hypothetical protein
VKKDTTYADTGSRDNQICYLGAATAAGFPDTAVTAYRSDFNGIGDSVAGMGQWVSVGG